MALLPQQRHHGGLPQKNEINPAQSVWLPLLLQLPPPSHCSMRMISSLLQPISAGASRRRSAAFIDQSVALAALPRGHSPIRSKRNAIQRDQRGMNRPRSRPRSRPQNRLAGGNADVNEGEKNKNAFTPAKRRMKASLTNPAGNRPAGRPRSFFVGEVGHGSDSHKPSRQQPDEHSQTGILTSASNRLPAFPFRRRGTVASGNLSAVIVAQPSRIFTGFPTFDCDGEWNQRHIPFKEQFVSTPNIFFAKK